MDRTGKRALNGVSGGAVVETTRPAPTLREGLKAVHPVEFVACFICDDDTFRSEFLPAHNRIAKDFTSSVGRFLSGCLEALEVVTLNILSSTLRAFNVQ